MKSFQFNGVLALAAVAALSATALSLQDKGKPTAPDKGQPQGKVDKEMEAKWKAYATPGEGHKALEAKVGTWELKLKCYMGPEGPVESTATCESKWSLDKHFVEDHADGTWMGQPFHGVGFTGYDNLKKKYVMSWCDNSATGIMYSEGTYDPATKTFTYVGECPDVMNGKYARSRTVDKMIDDKHWEMKSYGPGPDGNEMLTMEMTATKK